MGGAVAARGALLVTMRGEAVTAEAVGTDAAPAQSGGPLTAGTVAAIEEAGLEVADVLRVVRAALDEDFRYGVDVTSATTVAGRTVRADVVAREAGVVAGLPVALAVLDLVGGYLAGSRTDAGAEAGPRGRTGRRAGHRDGPGRGRVTGAARRRGAARVR